MESAASRVHARRPSEFTIDSFQVTQFSCFGYATHGLTATATSTAVTITQI